MSDDDDDDDENEASTAPSRKRARFDDVDEERRYASQRREELKNRLMKRFAKARPEKKETVKKEIEPKSKIIEKKGHAQMPLYILVLQLMEDLAKSTYHRTMESILISNARTSRKIADTLMDHWEGDVQSAWDTIIMTAQQMKKYMRTKAEKQAYEKTYREIEAWKRSYGKRIQQGQEINDELQHRRLKLMIILQRTYAQAHDTMNDVTSMIKNEVYDGLKFSDEAYDIDAAERNDFPEGEEGEEEEDAEATVKEDCDDDKDDDDIFDRSRASGSSGYAIKDRLAATVSKAASKAVVLAATVAPKRVNAELVHYMSLEKHDSENTWFMIALLSLFSFIGGIIIACLTMKMMGQSPGQERHKKITKDKSTDMHEAEREKNI
jgi:hypothetical protein